MPSKTPADHTSLRNAAIRLLAQREYGRQELAARLKRQGRPQQVEQVLEELVAEGLQSDERYAQSLLRSRIARGQGPVRIGQEMQHKGLERALVDQILEEADVDWDALAETVWQRRFGGDAESGGTDDEESATHSHADLAREQARQLRFMLYRGFTPDQARRVLALLR